MKHENGVMKMHEIEGGLALPDGLTVKLMPKGPSSDVYGS